MAVINAAWQLDEGRGVREIGLLLESDLAVADLGLVPDRDAVDRRD
jgi:hypothetical protein